MLKIKHLQLNWLGIGIICSVISATITPAAAQRIIINQTVRINQQPAVGSFIYGSPISTPMPVNPATGLMPRHSDRDYHSYPVVRPVNPRRRLIPRHSDRDYHSYPVVRPRSNRGSNSGLINPTLINPVIPNSTFVNPVIFNHNSRQPTSYKGRSQVRMNRHRVRSTGQSSCSISISQVIFNCPR
ncbi:hypothetical protein [Anabaena sp. CCY 0017]|uniref:hypothetical protein n=1 Tax=Anabaena sp. CCY 0017 TaxID=3103866 RepID=UPI0039C5DA6C